MIQIRPMQPSDIAHVTAWMLRVPLWQRYGFTAERGQQQFEQALLRGDLLRVADLPDNPARGFCRVVLNGAFARSAYLQLIGVDPHCSGMGIGAALLAHIEDAVRDHHQDLFLLASDFNADAHRFYRRHGYRQIGTIPGYVLADVDELIFWKRLTGGPSVDPRP